MPQAYDAVLSFPPVDRAEILQTAGGSLALLSRTVPFQADILKSQHTATLYSAYTRALTVEHVHVHVHVHVQAAGTSALAAARFARRARLAVGGARAGGSADGHVPAGGGVGAGGDGADILRIDTAAPRSPVSPMDARSVSPHGAAPGAHRAPGGVRPQTNKSVSFTPHHQHHQPHESHHQHHRSHHQHHPALSHAQSAIGAIGGAARGLSPFAGSPLGTPGSR